MSWIEKKNWMKQKTQSKVLNFILTYIFMLVCPRKLRVFPAILFFILPLVEIFSQSQKIEKVGTQELISVLDSKESPVHIINFWASWCAPCIKELPDLQSVADNHKQVKLTLVSLDFEDALTSKVIPLLNKKHITARCVLMTNTDYDTWIDKIESRWDGTIPMTLIIDNRKNAKPQRYFFPKPFTLPELQKTVARILRKI